MSVLATTSHRDLPIACEFYIVETKDEQVARLSSEVFDAKKAEEQDLQVIREKDREIKVLKSELIQASEIIPLALEKLDQAITTNNLLINQSEVLAAQLQVQTEAGAHLLTTANRAIAANVRQRQTHNDFKNVIIVSHTTLEKAMKTSRIYRNASIGGSIGLGLGGGTAFLAGAGPLGCLVGATGGFIIGSFIGGRDFKKSSGLDRKIIKKPKVIKVSVPKKSRK